jgi:hypothetical protein
MLEAVLIILLPLLFRKIEVTELVPLRPHLHWVGNYWDRAPFPLRLKQTNMVTVGWKFV